MSALSRRDVLVGTLVTSAALVVRFQLGCTPDVAIEAPVPMPPAPPAPQHALDAAIAIGTDGLVHLVIAEAEMGQGILTSLAMILADELEAPWHRVRATMAGADDRFGRQSTGGSTSVRMDHDPLRTAAATAKAMLIAAAAAQWQVAPEACVAREGAVHQGEASLDYGALAEAAAALPVPTDVAIKPVSARTLTGQSLPRLDIPDKVTGATVFGLDVRLNGLLYARIVRPPAFGGAVATFDADAALAVPGVADVVQVPSGIAVVAAHTWAAIKGCEALNATFDPGPHADLDDAAVRARCVAVIEGGAEAANRGDVKRALKADRVLTAEYEVPYLAHACMEPMNCTALVQGGKVEVWAPTQGPTGARDIAAEAAGVDKDAVTLHATFMGGGFGRRSKPDFVADAVHVAKATAGRPVQVSWSREDDMRGGWYRPVSLNRLQGAVGPDGLPIAWQHQIATPSILAGMGRGGDIDGTSIEGAANLPYAIANFRVTCAAPELPVPLWFWRSVGGSQNGFVTECFLDELLALGGRDPVEGRLAMLGSEPRHARVLQRVAEMAHWDKGATEGHALGVAVHASFGSICAQVADVSLDGTTPRVHKVWCAIDCGQVVNPDTVVAQMESGIAYGLSAALYGKVSLAGGAPQASNFHDQRIIRLHEMPQVEVEVVAAGDPWGGVGEPGTPPLAPAVCNALRKLTGTPVRRLPLV